MNTRRLVIILASIFGVALVLTGGYFINAQARTQAVIDATFAAEGYCFIPSASGAMLTEKTTPDICFSELDASYWCQGLGETFCIENDALISVSQDPVAPPPDAHTTVPSSPASEPQQPTTPPAEQPVVEEDPNAYINEPFGDRTEPDLCLNNDKRFYESYDYEDSIKCFTTAQEDEVRQVCDYLGECFEDERAYVDYLRFIAREQRLSR